MILFVVVAIGILIYTIFAKDFLIYTIKNFKNHKKSDYKSIKEIVLWWILYNIAFNFVNVIIVFIVSAIVVFAYPRTETQHSFNINSLKDNLVTSGEIHGSAFCIRGSIDGEISYFFSRTTDKGENIGHIPAEDCYIKYDDESKPHIEVHQTTHEFPKWLQKVLWVDFLNSTNAEYYVIIVPEDTISVDGTYQIDME